MLVSSACEPSFRPSEFLIWISAEYTPGAGCCRFAGILIVSFWP